MKKLLLICLFIISAQLCFSQGAIDSLKLHIIDSTVVYEKIVNADSLSKATLFNVSQEWFVKAFNSGKSVIQMKDAETGRIMGSGTGGNFEYMDHPFVLNFTVQIDVKDKKARIRINDMGFQWLSSRYSVFMLYNEYTKEKFSLQPMFFGKKLTKSIYLSYLTQVNYVGTMLTESYANYISKYKKDDF